MLQARRVAAAFLGLVLLALPFRAAHALEKASVQLKWKHHFQFAGYYAALEKGFYRDAGLDVEIREGGPFVEVEKEVHEGRADFGVGTSAVLVHLAQGRDLVVLGQVFQHSPAIFLTPRKSGIRSIADMAGKRVMHSNQHGDLMALLRQSGISESDFVQVPHDGDPEDLIRGKADVQFAYSFNEPFALERVGEPYLAFSPLQYGVDFYGDNFFTRRKTVEERPELARAFREATLRGWRYAMANKAEVADLILSKYSKAKSREWLLFEANQMETLIQPTLVELGYQNPLRWRQIADTLVELGLIPAGFDPSPVVYAPEPKPDYRALVGTVLVAGVIIAVLAGMLLAFRRLNRRLSSAHEELKRSAEQLRVLFESAQAGILMIDPEGRITLLNQRMGELFACPPEALAGSWYPDLLHPDQRSLGTGMMRKILSGEIDRVDAQRHYLRKDGTDFWGHISVRRHNDADGKLITLVCHITDITELKRAEEERVRVERQLLHAQKLESLGVLAGGIAHDFNNLLAGILGNVSFARMFLEPGHRSSSILLEAENACRRASGLALQLLTFAKGGEPVKKAVDAGRLVRESVTLVLSGSTVRCDFDLPADLLPIEADEGQIGQVFSNLALNAAQSMPGGGTIKVSAENASLDEVGAAPLPAGRYVRFRVADKGCGIPPDHQKRIFDPYYSNRAGGNGLGLASVWSIVGKHGGRVEVQSEVGVGSVFSILLPASGGPLPAAGAGEHPASSPGPAAGASVLVMDDEEMIRNLVADMLSELGYRVQTCGDGEAAIERYQAALESGTPFSAVIMDLTVPGGMGGTEAARRILEIDPDARLIVSSGYSTDPVLAGHLQYGFRATIGKPYDMATFERVLSGVLSDATGN